MKKSFWLITVLLFGGLVAAACGQAPQPPPAPKTPPVEGAVSASVAGWEKKWEAVLSEAKKESMLAIYASWSAELRGSLTSAFRRKYGIELQFSTAGRGEELVVKFQAERRAGLHIADVFGIGVPTNLNMLKPAGLSAPIQPSLLMLPEATDPGAWRHGQLFFADKDRHALVMVGQVSYYLGYNTDLIREGEITTYKDLLNPRYRSKITLNDPRLTGPGNAVMAHLAFHLWNVDETMEFLRRLIKEQQVVMQTDNRMVVESVARGKYAIGLGLRQESLAQFIEFGAPIAGVVLKEGHAISSGAGVLSIADKAPHPNAAAVFINWLLTREGQALFSKAFGTASLRVDVPAEGINPIFVIKPGMKTFNGDDPEYTKFKGEMLQIAGRVIAEVEK